MSPPTSIINKNNMTHRHLSADQHFGSIFLINAFSPDTPRFVSTGQKLTNLGQLWEVVSLSLLEEAIMLSVDSLQKWPLHPGMRSSFLASKTELCYFLWLTEYSITVSVLVLRPPQEFLPISFFLLNPCFLHENMTTLS